MRAVIAWLSVGGFLASSLCLTGCGGASSNQSSQSDQIVKGASITKQAKVTVATGPGLVPGEVYTYISLKGEDGQTYWPVTLDAAFQKDGLRVQFTATVDSTEPPADGPAGIYVTLTSIKTL